MTKRMLVVAALLAASATSARAQSDAADESPRPAPETFAGLSVGLMGKEPFLTSFYEGGFRPERHSSLRTVTARLSRVPHGGVGLDGAVVVAPGTIPDDGGTLALMVEGGPVLALPLPGGALMGRAGLGSAVTMQPYWQESHNRMLLYWGLGLTLDGPQGFRLRLDWSSYDSPRGGRAARRFEVGVMRRLQTGATPEAGS